MFYVEFLVKIFWLIIFLKVFLFWLWLWQLKEYRIDRFKAHFETQKIKKIISCLWWLKYPKFTKKIIVIFLVGAGLAILWLFYLSGFLLVILTPLFSSFLVLFFQIPTVIWRNNVLKKAKQKRAKFKDLPSHLGIGGEGLIVIGITGSYGKSSTKEFLSIILSEEYNVLKTEGNVNTEIGVAETILKKLKREHQIFICEMAAYNKGEIKLLCDIIQPRIGIVTGVNEQHLALFGSMENLLSAEGGRELIESLPEGGMAFFNAKNSYCRELYNQTKLKKFLYGEEVKIAGLENIEGAKLVARELGMSEEKIEQGAAKIMDKFPGIKIKRSKNGLDIINATYSVNPTGVLTHLDFLKNWSGKKIIIMPCLIELGSASKRIHQEIGEKIAEICDLAIITTKDYFKEISHSGVRPHYAKNSALILEKLKQVLDKKDNSNNVLLLEGRLPEQLIEEIEKL
jgi:UDP-N-acetylmuramoyl-tripeptide--D-alanyl-D-alanine ligase